MAKLLGKLDPKQDGRNLMAARYLAPIPFPASYDWQYRRRPMPARAFGNDRYGDCTLASQANATSRFERIEQRRTVLLADDLVVSNYLAMTGGEDSGWYELDALKRWRTIGFSVSPTRTYTIDAFAQIHQANVAEVKAALWQFKAIKVCFNLPLAWERIEPHGYVEPGGVEGVWGTGSGSLYRAGSWGGHSMTADGYNSDGILVVHSWYRGPTPARQLVTWDAVRQYADEAYSVVDSFDAWRHRKPAFDLNALRADVAEVTTD